MRDGVSEDIIRERTQAYLDEEISKSRIFLQT